MMFSVLGGPDAVQYAEGVRALYVEAGWLKPEEKAEYLPELLRKSHLVSCAVTPEGRLIGMMRALSDGVSDAYLLDMVVHPDFRRKGIAKRILDSLVDALKAEGVDWIVCISVPGVEGLYLRKGTRMEGHTPVRFL